MVELADSYSLPEMRSKHFGWHLSMDMTLHMIVVEQEQPPLGSCPGNDPLDYVVDS